MNADLVHSLGLTLQPTNIRTATLGDGETSMSIVGEVRLSTEYLGNPIKVTAVVAKEMREFSSVCPEWKNAALMS